MELEITTVEQSSPVVVGEIVQSRAQQAWHLRLGGVPLYEIAQKLGYKTVAELNEDIKTMLVSAGSELTPEERLDILEIELARLDKLQEVVWQQAMYGDLKAVETALKVMAIRIKITGLDGVDTQTGQRTVLVIGGQEAEYVEKLKRLSNG